MRMMSLASGSNGNAIYAGSQQAHILIDDGISCKKVESGLNTADLTVKDLDAVLISHEHSDHIGGLRVLLKKAPVPVYATAATIQAMRGIKTMADVDWSLFHPIEADRDFYIKDLKICPFHTSHDAADPVMYRIEQGDCKGAVATDLGIYDDYTIKALSGCRALYLEANYDLRMLQTGRYPYPLKRRIAGDKGHLCNEAAGKLLDRVLWDRMEWVFLSHLSQENNLPDLAYEAVRLEVAMSDSPYEAEDFRLRVARRGEVSECIEIGN